MADPNNGFSMRDMLIPGNADASSLVEQMDRKDNLFSQIGGLVVCVYAFNDLFFG